MARRAPRNPVPADGDRRVTPTEAARALTALGIPVSPDWVFRNLAVQRISARKNYVTLAQIAARCPVSVGVLASHLDRPS